jgi:hypothetical protein
MGGDIIKASGILTYSKNWIVVNLGRGFINYYWSLIPKARRYGLNKPMYPGHITVVRFKYEQPDYNRWGYLNGARIPFEYSPVIEEDQLYLFLRVWSEGIGLVRRHLRLPTFIHDRDCYHITVANKKG